jgi:hypothetical protein
LVGWASLGWDLTNNGMSVDISLNLRNEAVGDGVAVLMAGILGYEGIKTLAALGVAILNDAGFIAALKMFTMEVNGVKMDLYTLLGGQAFESALRGGRVDWSGSTFSFGVKANGESYLSASVLVRDGAGESMGRFLVSTGGGGERSVASLRAESGE